LRGKKTRKNQEGKNVLVDKLQNIALDTSGTKHNVYSNLGKKVQHVLILILNLYI